MATQPDRGMTGYPAPESGEPRSSDDPDAIRREIETTRAELAGDVDRLADRTSPKRVARRGWDRLGSRVSSLKESVMGAPRSAATAVRDTTSTATGVVQDRASSAADGVRDAASSAADAVRQSPDLAREKARGNPLAAGLIAFGAGLLAATLLPDTQAERRAGEKLAEHGGDLIDRVREPVTEAASQVRQDAAESVKQSAQEVKSAAQEAAQTTTETAKESTQRATEEVRDTASGGTSRA
ncbi:MAG TPA: DUF3618 domain-containing protein [Pilimelia sp.]|nr:DUF3618 domain-containing protein [Pilimelia sp.]